MAENGDLVLIAVDDCAHSERAFECEYKVSLGYTCRLGLYYVCRFSLYSGKPIQNTYSLSCSHNIMATCVQDTTVLFQLTNNGPKTKFYCRSVDTK